MTRFAHSNFCEDIRNEVNNKFSLMGIIGPLLYVPEFPATLPKLCAVVTAITPHDQPFHSVIFKGTMGETVLFEFTMDESQLEQMRQSSAPIDEPMGFEAKAMVVLSPFHIPSPTKIKVTVVADGEEIRCGGLQISKAPEGMTIV